MTAVLAWIAAEWPQVRPNLEASVVWSVLVSIPATLLGQHVITGWHMRRVHARLDRHGVAR